MLISASGDPLHVVEVPNDKACIVWHQKAGPGVLIEREE